MRLISWSSLRIYRSIVHGGSFTRFKPENIFIIFMLNPAPYFRGYNSLLKKDFRSSQVCEANAGKKAKNNKFTNKNEFKSSVSLSKREFEDLNIAKPTESEVSQRKLSNNKFGVKVSVKNKTKDDLKKFKIRDVISDHDLEIKIDSMVKYLKKGRKVFCEVTTASKTNEFEKILKKLNNSKLKDYFIETKMSQAHLCVTFFQKVTNKESDEVEEKKTDKSS